MIKVEDNKGTVEGTVEIGHHQNSTYITVIQNANLIEKKISLRPKHTNKMFLLK